MTRTPTQAHATIAVNSSLGDDALLLRKVEVEEELSRPFAIRLELLAVDKEVPFADILGSNVSVRIDHIDRSPRWFNGYVSHFQLLGHGGNYITYEATLSPFLWFMSRNVDCRIFQDMTCTDIIAEVFRLVGLSDYETSYAATYPTEEYTVQYMESDFDFVHRLMERAGIHYRFKFEEGKHTIVLSDDSSGATTAAAFETIPFREPGEAAPDFDCITNWNVRVAVQSGSFAMNDFDFATPRADLFVRSQIIREHALASLEVYEYPGAYKQYSDGETFSRVRIEELAASYEVMLGESCCRGIEAGNTFALSEHRWEEQNRSYLVTQTRIRATTELYETGATDGDTFSCSLTAIDATTAFRPRRVTPQPVMRGPQTAIVVGPSGQEIYTDEYGRVRVMFHWDRYPATDGTSSCWIRVSQAAAGGGWGAISLPRVGQEVIVDFLNGDPDRPIIVGRVYNGIATVPYALPDNATVSTFKSSSSPDGAGFNELRFEDKNDAEQIFLHGQKDLAMRVLNDRKEWVGNDRQLTVVNDHYEKIENDQHIHVVNDQKEQVEGDVHRTLAADEMVSVGGSQHVKIATDSNSDIGGDTSITEGANHNQSTGGDYSLDVTGKIQAKSGGNIGIEAAQEVHVKAGTNLILEAGVQLTLKVGGNFVVIGPAGVDITGTLVNINSGGAAGSGSGCSPTAPAAVTEPEAPAEVAEVDDAEAGTVTEWEGTAAEREASPNAQVLVAASESGAAFCERCE